MKKSLIGILILFASTQVFAQKIALKRVCNGGNNNQLTWQNIPNSCLILGNLKLYAKESLPQTFYLIDNNVNPNNGNYTHINANVPSVKDWYYYFEYTQICGTDTSIIFSDTLQIDDIKPDSTVLDSVSVDPINNVVLLGWTSNKTPDFSAYYLYNYDRADPRLIENYRDTFYIDIIPVNPKSKSLSYDITSSDSCDNRKEYGAYQHKTICLKGGIDTCINKVSLNWNAYVGWEVAEYHVFRSINNMPFEWLAIVPGNTLAYEDNINSLGVNTEYFVRARKLNSANISSSSNMSPIFITGKSISPTNTLIKQVSNNLNQNLEIEISRNPIANYLNIELRRIDPSNINTSIQTFTNNQSIHIDAFADNKVKYQYYLLSRNMCGEVSDSSAFSNNIVLTVAGNEDDIELNWSRYFTWNTGVKEYVIYRASGNTVNEAVNFVEEVNSILDTSRSISKGEWAVNCFYIQALSNDNISNSKSNIACLIKAGNIYYPNAIVPNGINKNFTFVGEGIDLENSSISIYNRWGQLEYEKLNIETGWNGVNLNGNEVSSGVYFFIAKIRIGLETKEINGSITVIR
ncbi:MAG: gliding motility-associated C-terminal domain-containing protein [Bacteroidia bacterium]